MATIYCLCLHCTVVKTRHRVVELRLPPGTVHVLVRGGVAATLSSTKSMIDQCALLLLIMAT